MSTAIATQQQGGALALSDAQRLRQAVTYDPLTGLFHRAKASSWAKVGDVAGCTNTDGYVEFNVLGRLHRANRLAWLYMTGEWPTGMVDHWDGDKGNNAFLNLRDVTNRVNCENRRLANRNNRTGLLGVKFHQSTGKYEARIRVGGRLKYLGVHATAEAAHAVYIDAKRVHHEGNTL